MVRGPRWLGVACGDSDVGDLREEGQRGVDFAEDGPLCRRDGQVVADGRDVAQPCLENPVVRGVLGSFLDPAGDAGRVTDGEVVAGVSADQDLALKLVPGSGVAETRMMLRQQCRAAANDTCTVAG